MPLTSTLRHFLPSEFRHPDLLEDFAAVLLDEMRDRYGKPIVVTDDGRPLGSVPPSGGARDSLHYPSPAQGLGSRAFDLRTRDKTPGDMYDMIHAAQSLDKLLKPMQKGIEIEIVDGPTDKHLHVGFYLNGHGNKLITRLD